MRSRIFVLGLALAMSATLFAQTSGGNSNPPTQETAAQKKDREQKQRIMDAVALYKAGNVAQAKTNFEGLYSEIPENVDVQVWLGFIYLRSNESAKAVPLLAKAAKARPKDLEVQTNYGNALLETEQLDAAITQFDVVSKLSPTMSEPHYNKGTVYLKKKDFAKAVTSFTEADRLKPNDAFTLNNLGVAYEGVKNTPEAANKFKQAADLRPDHKTFSRNAGFKLIQARRVKEAIPYLERVYKMDTNDLMVATALAETYAAEGRRADALKMYEAIKDGKADNAQFWFNLGVMRAANNDPAGAEVAYRKALDIDGSDLDTINNLGLLLYRQGKYEEARVLFDKLVGLNPSSMNARINLGAATARSGGMDAAILIWKDIIRKDPAQVGIRLDLANALWAAGDQDGARYHYTEVVKVNAKSAPAWNGIGMYHLQRSKFPEAERSFRSAIQADSKFTPAYNNLAITLEKMNKKAQAILLLERAHKIDPNDQDVKRNLDRLKAAG